MKSILRKAAESAGCSDLHAFATTLEDALSNDRPVIDEILDAGYVDEEKFLANVADGLGMEWVESPVADPDERASLQSACSAGVALQHRFLPISFVRPEVAESEEEAKEDVDPGIDPFATTEEEDSSLLKIRLATYDPMNLIARQAARKKMSRPIRWCLTSRKRLLPALQTFYGVGAETFEEILKGRDVDLNDLEMRDEANIIDEDDEEASVVKFVNQIIRDALSQRATDIHLEPLAEGLRIRYRIDGVLHDIAVPENIRALQSSVIARLKVMARLDIAEKRLPQDGRIALKLDEKSLDVRVATIPSVEGESVSLRLLGQDSFTLDKLGMLPEQRALVDRLIEQPNGIVLVTGPTGCGKSTSLYTFLSAINSESLRIVTIEDPVENKLPGVVQIAVKSEIGLTFADGLRSILRGDPNVIMVGEIRDLETAEIAIRSALTGHLVFSTLHTNDAIGGITRLIDMGVEPFLVGASVRAFIAQRLVRRLCPNCKVPIHYSDEYLDSVQFPAKFRGIQLYAPHDGGCDSCRGIGYHGRMAIYEICELTNDLQDMVVAKASHKELKRHAVSEGFITMRDYGWQKVSTGETTAEEVIAVTQEEA